jgi:DNA invertase Pin-like site-specific DNA recombinase
VFAEFERNIIQERIRAGIAKSRAQGTKSGKAFPGRPRGVADRQKRHSEGPLGWLASAMKPPAA